MVGDLKRKFQPGNGLKGIILVFAVFGEISFVIAVHGQSEDQTCEGSDAAATLTDFRVTPRSGTVRLGGNNFKAMANGARAEFKLKTFEPFTPTALSLAFVNVKEIRVHLVARQAGGTQRADKVHDVTGRTDLQLSWDDSTDPVIRMVVNAVPRDKEQAAMLNVLGLAACMPAPATSTETTSLSSGAMEATEQKNTCGVSRELDSVQGVDSEQTAGANTESCSLVPWQVRLNVTEGQHSRFCAGSVLDATHILSAAHCFKDDSTVEVTVGDYSLDNTETTEQTRIVRATDVAMHPEYYSNAFGLELNDVAVIRLSEPLDMTQPCTEPVCLEPDFALTDGQNCTVSGWSSLAVANGLTMTGKLQFANLATYQGNQCLTAFNIPLPFYVVDPNNQLCAGYKQDGVDPCQGDAGGPLVCRDNAADAYVQVGIVSYGNGCGMKNFPGMYTKVSSYYDWIHDQLHKE